MRISFSKSKTKKESIPDSHKFTPDFNSVIFIIVWNSLGFFFIEFMITYLIKQVWSSSAAQLGLFFSFITLGGLISSSFVGYLADRISKKKLVMIGAFGRGSSYFGLYISILFQSLNGIYISAFLLGVGAYLFWIPLDTIISEKSSKYYRSSAFGKRRFALGIGLVIGTVVGFSIFGIASAFIPENNFILYGVIPIYGIANFYAGIKFWRKVDEDQIFKYPDEDIQELSVEQDHISDEPKPPVHFYLLGIILLFSGFFLSAINIGFYRPFIQPFVLENINSNAGLVAWFYLPTAVIGTLIAPKLGTLADNINPYIGIIFASFLGGIVTLLIINSANLLIFAFLLIVDNTIMMTVNFVFINFLSRVSIKNRGKIFGLVAVLESIGMIIGPLLGGIVWDTVSKFAPFIISVMVEWALIPFFIIGIYILLPHIVESKKNKIDSQKT
ncbi:hypothetical protein LCGC14_1135520 [marine sediment metagenome]|uniref:Major facilitator superfamily (MFS) profile domain-containing protein n=1 Tax=marine sediment metagenome TaxID=412755 RepID=A0A0F9PI13_9ZZZZ